MTRHLRSQDGYTLIEVVITAALGALLMTALTSVILTANQAVTTASNRVEASSQIRSFEYFAYDDFALSDRSRVSGSATSISLAGTQASNNVQPVFNPNYTVTYTWDSSSNVLDRQVGANPAVHAATNVTAFSWFVDANGTVVVNLTVTVGAYSESQTFRFYPSVNP